MLGAIHFAHVFVLVGTANIYILLSFKSIQQDVPKAAIKVDFDSGYNLFKNIGFGGPGAFGVVRLLGGAIVSENFNDIRLSWKRNELAS
jgi:hypothetical protein